MTVRKTKIPTGGAGGVDSVPAFLDGPASAEWLLVVAPGAGAPADSEFMTGLADRIAAAGVRTLRFDFPYQVRARAQGSRSAPDRAPVLLETWRRVLAHAARYLRHAHIAVGGKSMGGRYATLLLAEAAQPGATPIAAGPEACVLFGYPLHPPGKPEQLRTAHLSDIGVPCLFFGGTRDSLARIDALRASISGIPSAELHEIDAADHDFKVPKSTGRSRGDIIDEMARGTAAFLDGVASQSP